MKVAKITVFLLVAGLIYGCNIKPDPKKKIDMISNPDIKLRDTAYEKYYQGVLFSPHIVRLDNAEKPAFIQVDSCYFNMKALDKNTREDYYKRVIALLPKQELEVHRLIWKIADVRGIQQGNGGEGTIVSAIREVLDEKSGYYLADLKRNDVEQMSPIIGISTFRIRLHPLNIEVADESGYFLSLASWQQAQKSK